MVEVVEVELPPGFPEITVESTATMEDLKRRIAELEEELKKEKTKNESSGAVRQKITQMSSEVVDSNPYR